MSNIIYYGVVLGDPKPQARHRHFSKGKFSSTYDPTAEKKGSFVSIIQDDAPGVPWDCPLSLELSFYFHRPKNHFGTGKNADVLKATAPEWHTNTPDIDNLQKFVQDSMNKIFYKDDSSICQITARKLYSDRPRTEITIKILL